MSNNELTNQILERLSVDQRRGLVKLQLNEIRYWSNVLKKEAILGMKGQFYLPTILDAKDKIEQCLSSLQFNIKKISEIK